MPDEMHSPAKRSARPAPEGPVEEVLSPVDTENTGPSRLDIAAGMKPKPVSGTALCLSGGGYRAMVFHLGALWRLNEAGWLPQLDRVSSVSGGSILAGFLGLKWRDLAFDHRGVATNLLEVVVEPVRRLAGITFDVSAVLEGVLLPGTVADRVTAELKRHLFGEATLQALPEHPMFVINATSVQTGALWRFTRWYMWDYHVGKVPNPVVPLARAVAASAAFPPVLSPVDLDLEEADFTPGTGLDLQRPPFTTHAVLTDGGVYDNLGLETAWKNHETILVSDGGGQMEPEEDPPRDWVRHAFRVFEIVDNQVRSLRKRQAIDSYVEGVRKGTYWSVRTDIAHYGLPSVLDCPFPQTTELAGVPTRLQHLDGRTQERLINWGYAVCDAALRRHVDPTLPLGAFPYPRGVAD